MHALEISEVSSDGSVVSHVLGDAAPQPLQSPAPAYASPELPRFPSWDRSWVGGGIVEHHGHPHGFIERAPRSEAEERWAPGSESLDDCLYPSASPALWQPAPMYRSAASEADPLSPASEALGIGDRDKAARIRALDRAYAPEAPDPDDVARRAARRAATIRTVLAIVQILLALAAALGSIGAAFVSRCCCHLAVSSCWAAALVAQLGTPSCTC